ILLLRCSREADSMSRSTSFCPSTMATRSSSCWVALNNMRFTLLFSCARRSAVFQPVWVPQWEFPAKKKPPARVSTAIAASGERFNPWFGSGSRPDRRRVAGTGAWLAFVVTPPVPNTSCGPCASQLEARPRIIIKMKDLSKPQVTWLEVGQESDAQRIANFLLRTLKGVPKSHVYRVLRSGEVRVNSGRVKPEYRLKIGDRVRVPPVRTAVARTTAIPRLLDLHVIYEDAALLVVDKA